MSALQLIKLLEDQFVMSWSFDSDQLIKLNQDSDNREILKLDLFPGLVSKIEIVQPKTDGNFYIVYHPNDKIDINLKITDGDLLYLFVWAITHNIYPQDEYGMIHKK